MDNLNCPHFFSGLALPEFQHVPLAAIQVGGDVDVSDLGVHDQDQADTGNFETIKRISVILA